MTTHTDTGKTAAEHVLGHHERREIGLRLQDELVDLVDLSLIGKQLHWNVGSSSARCTCTSTSWSTTGASWRTPWRSAPRREDVMIDTVRKLEGQLWMIRAQFESG